MFQRCLPYLCLLLLPIAMPALAERYLVGVEAENLSPYYHNKGDQYQGFARELLDLFAKKQEVTLEYKALPITRLYRDFLDGSVDLKFPDNPNWQTDSKKGHEIHYSDPVVDYIDGTLVHSSQVGRGKEGLNTLGIIRGFTPWDYLDAIDSGDVELSKTSNADSLLRQADAKRVDGIYYNVVVAEQLSAEKDLSVEFDENLPHTRGQFMLASKKHPELIERFNKFLENNQDAVDNLKAEFGLEEF